MFTKFYYALLFCSIFSMSATFAQTQGKQYDTLAKAVLVLLNEHRAGMGLKALTMNETISKGAIMHSRDMASKKIPFGHDGFDKRMAQIGKQLKNPTGWAENVAEGANTAHEVVDLWLHSPMHKKNIEGDYNTTGIGIAPSKEGTLYYTQIFFKQ